MSRRNAAVRREIGLDPRFNSEMIAKFINVIMSDGKKSISERILYGAMDLASEKSSKAPVDVVKEALEKVSPVVEVRSKRVGGATYQVPVELQPARRRTLGMRWLIEAARKRSEHSMNERLANEMLEAIEGHGSAVKKRESVHKMADANKAFAHYRW
ncbi:MAG: 30S ribosomal protein S7 [Gammaproteobacteria bacterium]|nr:30S ribosomal protein S7 [Pseudomonadota bacterium]MCH9662261.1 30S ribosomal protein S7 [Gammaproteobacteria bacterium]